MSEDFFGGCPKEQDKASIGNNDNIRCKMVDGRETIIILKNPSVFARQ